MGWGFGPIDKSTKTEDYLIREWEDYGNHRIVYSHLAPRNADGHREWYAAIEKLNGDNKGEVFACVTLVQRSHGEIGTKSMSEDMGPFYHDVPMSILDYLTPTESQYALEWRQRVKDRNWTPPAALKPGDVVLFDNPIQFQDGEESSELTFSGRYSFVRHDGRDVRLPKNWKRMFVWQVAQ